MQMLMCSPCRHFVSLQLASEKMTQQNCLCVNCIIVDVLVLSELMYVSILSAAVYLCMQKFFSL